MAPKKKAESSSKNAGDNSATVEESNEMRARLGIKPLAKDDGQAKQGTSAAPLEGGAAANLKKGPSAQETKEKRAAEKNRREHEEFTSGKGLGDILKDEEAGGVSDWIARTRADDGKMKTPAGAASSSAAAEKKRKKDVSGAPSMKVRHDADSIAEGTTQDLVLEDKPLLDKDGNLVEQDDELVNVRMTDLERAKHHEALRNQQEYDNTKTTGGILEKYDELQTGPKGFTLDAGGRLPDELDPEKRLALLTQAAEKQTLEMKAKLQADYYTAEEMLKMKKPSKKKMKKRKAMDTKSKDPENSFAVSSALNDGQQPDSDEEDPELYEQLSKQRRLVKRSDTGAAPKGEAAIAAVSDRIGIVEEQKKTAVEPEEPAILGVKKGQAGQEDPEKVALTATTEFCNIVQTPIEKMETMKHESFRGSTLYKQQAQQRRGVKVAQQKGLAQGKIIPDDLSKPAINVLDLDEDPTSIDEASLDMSCASGLAYLRARSQIGNDQESHKNRKSDNRPLEMSTVEGDIKLEYRDDYGRVQTPKEAFRAISWKFHGKTPGRKNLERRLSRLENEMKLKSMNVIETLPTLRALRHIQHADAKPYMVLSGQNEK